jgi:acetyl-CoA carboxylase carboxyl transferase subunit beta
MSVESNGRPALSEDPKQDVEKEAAPRRSRLRWKKKDMPGGLWVKCDACSATIYRKDLEENSLVCPTCSFHFTVSGSDRIHMVADEGSYEERFAGLEGLDRLGFQNEGSYADKLKKTAEKTGNLEALLCGLAAVEERPVVLCVLDFKFLGGSMGEVVGEKFALACELAASTGRPLIVFTSSGGARMHEGVLSLMQMAKTCSALAELTAAGGFSICVMANPTTGGVTASFAMVTDLVLAEPGALIGFAGPRVIATTIKQELPPGFQRAEFLLEKGHVDAIVPRTELRQTLARLIDYAKPPEA